MGDEMSMSLDEIIQRRSENSRPTTPSLIISRKFKFGDGNNGVLKKRFINRYGLKHADAGKDMGFISVPLNQRTFPLGTPKNKLNLVKKANIFKTRPNGMLNLTSIRRAQTSQNFQFLKKTPVRNSPFVARQKLYQRILAKKKVANAIRALHRRQQQNTDSDLKVTIANDFKKKTFGSPLNQQNLARFNAAFGGNRTSRTVTPEGSIITTISQSVRGGRTRGGSIRGGSIRGGNLRGGWKHASAIGSNCSFSRGGTFVFRGNRPNRSFRGGTFTFRASNRQSRPRSRNDFDNPGSRSGSTSRASRSGSVDRLSRSGSVHRFFPDERQRSRSHSRQRSLSRGRAPSLSRQIEVPDEVDLEHMELNEDELENLQSMQSEPFNLPGSNQNGRPIVTFNMKAKYTDININDRFSVLIHGWTN